MKKKLWLDRVVVDPEIHHGDPCIKGTRIPVSIIIGSLGDGLTPQEILREYPQLGDEDIRAALQYAAEVLHNDIILPIAV
jgi:uncharacterized protein (DUF433 family)